MPTPTYSIVEASLGTDVVAGSTSTAVSLAIGSADRGFVNSSGDHDYFAVSLVSGHTYTFGTDAIGVGAIPDSYLQLRDSGGSLIVSDDDSGPLHDALLTYTATATGTFYLDVQGYGSNVGQYIVTAVEGSSRLLPTVSYQDAADYLTNSYWEVNGTIARHFASPTGITFDVTGLESERAALARIAFHAWENVSGLTFTEVTSGAQIVLDDLTGGSNTASTGGYTFSGGYETHADVNVPTNWYGGIDAIDSYTLQTFIHEIGHAIGLGHAGSYNGADVTYANDAVYINDTWQMSIMSYMPQSNYGGASYRFDMTPMVADILAVQSMYGAGSHMTGNDWYGTSTNTATTGGIYDFTTYTSPPALTIVDDGGAGDAIFANYSDNQLIDLRPGSYSNIGGLVGNVGIYLTSTIESAISGSGNDTIYGNDAENWIIGNGGNDTIYGGLGTDYAGFATLGTSANYTITHVGGTVYTVTGTGVASSMGTDTLTDVENVVFSDTTVKLFDTLTEGDDTFTGTSGDDIIFALGGNDTIHGNGGNDVIYGGSGTDSIDTTTGNDTIYGGDGGDGFYTHAGNDYIDGGAGVDHAWINSSIGWSGIALTNTANTHHWALHSADGDDTFDNVEVLHFTDYDFDCRADLTVSNMAVNRTHLLTGEQFHVTGYRVTNIGFENTPVTISQSLDNGSGVAVFSTAAVAHIYSVGVNNYVDGDAFDWTISTAGTHYLNVYADAGTGVEEVSESNNVSNTITATVYNHGTLDAHGFDAVFYLEQNPDVAAAGYTTSNAWNHYDASGWGEGRDPNALFSTSYYLSHNSDVAAANINPLTHYITNANSETGRDPSAWFDNSSYLAANSDVAGAGVNALIHFYNHLSEHRDAYLV